MRKLKTKNQNNSYRIGIYIRVSTEEQAENPEGSIRNQEQRLRDYVKQRSMDGNYGEIAEIFCDPGVSAKDMNRPALQRMLSKVKSGEINLVLVTEISRLTRATKDFALLWEFLKEHDCKFQSLRDNFDTTTPAGEMILFTLANFAQFERKQLGERVSNAFQARAKRGLWNGGVIPLGYDPDSEKPGHLKINPAEAEIVREAFATLLKKETLAATGKELNAKGIKLPTKLKGGGGFRHRQFTLMFLQRLLTNPAYIGRRIYETAEGTKEVQAAWDPIIDETTFHRALKLLKTNKCRRKPPTKNRYPYLLSGFTVCKTCGDRMSGRSANGNGGKIAYYEHAWATKSQSCLSKKVFSCQPHRILANRIEPFIWNDVKRLLSDPNYAKIIFEEAKSNAKVNNLESDIAKIKAKIASLENQIEATTERITELPKGINAQSFYDQILRLQEAREDFQVKLQTLQTQTVHRSHPLSINEFKKFTEDLKNLANRTTDPEIKASICRKLIEKIQISPEGVTIHYHVGDHHFEQVFPDTKGDIKSKLGLAGKTARPSFYSRPLKKYSLNYGSTRLTDGRS